MRETIPLNPPTLSAPRNYSHAVVVTSGRQVHVSGQIAMNAAGEIVGKGDPALKMIPVVMLTSSRQEQDLIRSYSLGANSYVRKPVDFTQFVEAVRQLGLYWLVINQAAPV